MDKYEGWGFVNVLMTPRMSTKPAPKANEGMDDRRNKHFLRGLTGVQKWESVCVQWDSRTSGCMTCQTQYRAGLAGDVSPIYQQTSVSSSGFRGSGVDKHTLH